MLMHIDETYMAHSALQHSIDANMADIACSIAWMHTCMNPCMYAMDPWHLHVEHAGIIAGQKMQRIVLCAACWYLFWYILLWHGVYHRLCNLFGEELRKVPIKALCLCLKELVVQLKLQGILVFSVFCKIGGQMIAENKCRSL